LGKEHNQVNHKRFIATLLLIFLARGAEAQVVAHWRFDGDLRDASGRGHNLTVTDARFAPGKSGQALQVGCEGSVPNSPDLQLAPGLRIECWVYFERHMPGFPAFVIKDREYQLRVDPIEEGGRFSFFVHLNGNWEPRVSSEVKPSAGNWYHLIAQWDGLEATLEVNGAKTKVKRVGCPKPGSYPLEVGTPNGMIDELRLENQTLARVQRLCLLALGLPPDMAASLSAPPERGIGDTPAAHWRFDGDLRDASGRGHELSIQEPRFAAGHSGQALQVGAEGSALNSPDLQLAPGLRLECWVKFQRAARDSHEYSPFVLKNNEYQLRVDPAREGGRFSFFVYLNGKWEPRVSSEVQAKEGDWYHLVAEWNGIEAALAVNDTWTRVARLGLPQPTANPLQISTKDGMIDELRVENPFFSAMREILATERAAPARVSTEHFGQAAGWQGWVGLGGAEVTVSADRLEATLPDTEAMIVNPSLDIDLDHRRYLSCDLSSPTLSNVLLTFVTDAGWGTASLPVQKEPHIAFVDLGAVDSWRDRLRLLAFWIPGEQSHRLQLQNLWVSSKPQGGPFLQVTRILQQHIAGEKVKLSAVVECLGSADREAKSVVARLVLPSGVKSLENSIYELGTIAGDSSRTLEWTLHPETEGAFEVEVQLTAANCPPSSRKTWIALRSPFKPLTPVVRPGGVSYYIDSVRGSNNNSGLSPQSPWRDFTNINGKVLNPGDRLLLKRGSVINQQLQVSAHGAVDNWVEIGAYGTGPRPIIRRNWSVVDRCALIEDPDYLWVHSLVLSCAGSGLLVNYTESGHVGLVIEDCIAYHIEGRYGGYRGSPGIPEWRDLPDLQPFGYCGIEVGGHPAREITFRQCEMFHLSSGFLAKGEKVMLDRIFVHDSYVHNTNPHPYLVSTNNAVIQNSVFDASGGHASRGTMGIMLGGTNGLTIRNCTFRNMPDAGCADQGGIDFEAGGNGCLVDSCTFENNAGAAIEVLGLVSPQTTNVEICNSRFIRNNWVKKGWGPAEIYVWEDGAHPDPHIVCSDGTIHHNGFVLVPGVSFFSNRAESFTLWRLSENTQYTSPEELRRAMPLNDPPIVEAGEDICSDQTSIQLRGMVKDDGQPADKRLLARWEVLEAPGAVTFADDRSPVTRATFATPGDYLLRLVGDDGELWTSDMIAVHVLSRGTSVAKAWEFNRQLDKEGWTEVDLGTQKRQEGSKHYEVSEPVKYVSGGFYIVAIENSSNGHLLSSANLGVNISKHRTIRVRFMNHTPARQMRFAFTTDSQPTWNDANSKTFTVIPNDTGPREYAVDMSDLAGWTGTLRQLRFDLATGTPLTGTCRIDYIMIDNSRPDMGKANRQ